MRLRYDPEVDALSIDLFDEPVEDTEEIEEGVIVDYDKSGRVISVEILDFMEQLEAARQERSVKRGLPLSATEPIQQAADAAGRQP
ncbi:MAG TPA: DUF2283 domain-containing protein [Chthonomonadaceae bacterium]|nr:DUF2283 domain-containing protein [Chthonomonadaceae bacterium]